MRLLYHASSVSDPREDKFKQMVQQYPDSAIGHYSLGRLYLEQRRFADAVPPLERACRLQADYAAAMVCLGDAYAGAARIDDARKTYEQAKSVALSQKHDGLAEEIQDKLDSL